MMPKNMSFQTLEHALAPQDLPCRGRQNLQVQPERAVLHVPHLDSLLEHPVLDAEDAQALTGASSSAAYGALDRLVADSVLHIAVARKRDRVWVAAAVIDEVEILLDALAE